MIRLAAEKLESFLDCNTDCAAPAPQADEEIRLEAGVDDVDCEFERIQQQVIGGDIGIVHFCSKEGLIYSRIQYNSFTRLK